MNPEKPVTDEEILAAFSGRADQETLRRVAKELDDPESEASEFAHWLKIRSKNALDPRTIDWAALMEATDPDDPKLGQ